MTNLQTPLPQDNTISNVNVHQQTILWQSILQPGYIHSFTFIWRHSSFSTTRAAARSKVTNKTLETFFLTVFLCIFTFWQWVMNPLMFAQTLRYFPDLFDSSASFLTTCLFMLSLRDWSWCWKLLFQRMHRSEQHWPMMRWAPGFLFCFKKYSIFSILTLSCQNCFAFFFHSLFIKNLPSALQEVKFLTELLPSALIMLSLHFVKLLLLKSIFSIQIFACWGCDKFCLQCQVACTKLASHSAQFCCEIVG